MIFPRKIMVSDSSVWEWKLRLQYMNLKVNYRENQFLAVWEINQMRDKTKQLIIISSEYNLPIFTQLPEFILDKPYFNNSNVLHSFRRGNFTK